MAPPLVAEVLGCSPGTVRRRVTGIATAVAATVLLAAGSSRPQAARLKIANSMVPVVDWMNMDNRVEAEKVLPTG